VLSDFDTVWVHENFMRIEGKEYHYYTLGTVARLTEVRPLARAYLHGIRPYVIGTVVIEPHRSIPDAPVHLAKGLQKEANEVGNTRRDNVLLVLNKRWFVKRGKQVDTQSLVRNAPGSVSLMTDPALDVVPQEFNDVTSSAYAEQDRVNVDMDELWGSFSQGSVQSNRKLNETVGGMQLLRGASNQMTQYLIATFSVTWVEPVLKQLDLLEQHYEDDAQFLDLMASRANFQKYGVDINTLPFELHDEFWKQILMQPMTLRVNVANSAMDPVIRLQLFLEATTRYTEIAQNAPPDLDRESVKEYIFGLLGFRDGSQFSVDPEGNPQLAAAMQQIQQLTQQMEGKYAEAQAKEESKSMIEGAKLDQKTQSDQAKLMMEERLEQQKVQTELMLENIRRESKEREVALQIEAKEREAESDRRLQLLIEQMKQSTEIMLARIDERARSKESESNKEEKQSPVQVIDSSVAPIIKESTTSNQKSMEAFGKALEKAVSVISAAIEKSNRVAYDIVEDKEGRAIGVKPRLN